jgi:hypothetical protein
MPQMLFDSRLYPFSGHAASTMSTQAYRHLGVAATYAMLAVTGDIKELEGDIGVTPPIQPLRLRRSNPLTDMFSTDESRLHVRRLSGHQ